MRIECPHCGTINHLAAAEISAKKTQIDCSHCQQSFPMPETAVCTVCSESFPQVEMIQFGTAWICAKCKSSFVPLACVRCGQEQH
jgi:predicted Zn finger-like uncharacterized protein